MQVEISKNYTRVEWRDDLMLMCKKAGAEPAVPSVFLFSDTQITNEGFVEDINNLLNSGEVEGKNTHRHIQTHIQRTTSISSVNDGSLLGEVQKKKSALTFSFQHVCKKESG